MHPVLFELFGFEIPTYGVILAADFLLVLYLMRKRASRFALDADKVADTAVVGLLAGLIGAKLLLILVDWEVYLHDPRQIVSTLRSAGVIYGGQIIGAMGVAWYLKRKKLPFWQTLDFMVPFLALGIGLGRLGCLAAGCCHGISYEGPLALHFPDHPLCEAPPLIGLFPIQLLALVNGIVLFLILSYLLDRKRFDGQIFFAFFILYGITRGLMEFLRGDEVRGKFFGGLISTSQIVALVTVILAAFLYWRAGRRR